MRSGLLVVAFRKAGDEVLEDVAHVVGGDFRGRHVGLGGIEVGNHLIENVALLHRRDLILELHLLKDVSHVLGKAVQVVAEIRGDVLRIGEKRLERELRRVVEIVARGGLEERVLHLKMLLGGILLLDLGMRRQKAVVKALHDCHRQDHEAVFMRLVEPGQGIGDVPENVRLFLYRLAGIESFCSLRHA